MGSGGGERERERNTNKHYDCDFLRGAYIDIMYTDGNEWSVKNVHNGIYQGKEKKRGLYATVSD